MTQWSRALRTDVDPAALEAGWQKVRERRSRARAPVRVFAVGAVALAAALLLLFALRRPDASAPGPLALEGGTSLPARWTPSAVETISLDDGSRLELAAATSLATKHTDGAHVDLALDRGRALFDVVPGGPRAWSIDAGDVVVRVLGTRFSVERADDAVEVVVERGKVMVEGPRVAGGTRILVAGQSLRVPRESAPARPRPALPRTEEPGPTIATPVRRPEDLPTAAPVLEATPTQSARAPAKQVTDLMARADAARRDGRPNDAIVLLHEVVDAKGRGAPLAAFTIAKVYAEDLAAPGVAAAWFTRAVRLGLPSGLDEEALARAVESYGKAGRREEAARAAARYRERFPNGRYLENVRGWAGEE